MQSHYRIDVTLTRIDTTSVEEQLALRERQIALAEAQQRIIALHADAGVVNQGMPLISQSIYSEAQRELSPRDYKPKIEEVEVFTLTANANEAHHLTEKVTSLLGSYYDDDALAVELDGPAHESGSADPEVDTHDDALGDENEDLSEEMDLPRPTRRRTARKRT